MKQQKYKCEICNSEIKLNVSNNTIVRFVPCPNEECNNYKRGTILIKIVR